MNIDVAETWFHEGQQQITAGETTRAIESFRNAATNDHDNAQYALALATALAAADHIEEARQALFRLRASEPEGAEINLSLARLSAKEHNISEAVRYYHNALFGTWGPHESADRITKVRTELVQFLLNQGDKSEALSELFVLSANVSDNQEAHSELGRLFLSAGDSQHALEQFNSSLRLNNENVQALRGAGQASFNLADYARADQFLKRAADEGDDSFQDRNLLETSQYVLTQDPLASGIGVNERVRRLTADLGFASQELRSCIGMTRGESAASADLQSLSIEVDRGQQRQFRPLELRRDSEGFISGLNLIRRIESAIEQICGESSSLHVALLLIARKHGVGEQ